MKTPILFLLNLILLTTINSSVFAQYRKITVIILRHAEKDLTNEDDSNPDLSAEGKLRAQKLVEIINKYQPEAIYSTDYERTRATVRPLARKRRMLTQIYSAGNPAALKETILSGKIKRLVVVGHIDSTPALVNLLLGSEKYKQLDEKEYDKIWIVKIKRHRKIPNDVRERVITY